MDNITALLNKWWSKPFDPAGDAVDWILFLGFAAVVLFAWQRVIRKISTE